ncbi:Ppx/GppA phosphatase family-domain-containing protein [Sporodiniella umbellata]|nr:Ppx/GppA phosphatase family-domain-containing protein [Sporodiniella umbellata]
MVAIFNETMQAPFGVVDMGSNGIRFGIVTALARHLPVTFEERAPISLLEVQGDRQYIPQETINQVVTSFLRFKSICRHEGVDQTNVKVIATEATRIALNSIEFLEQIHKATGWNVTILTKEQEASVSSMGIVGSFYNVNGLTMDLGGGSVELSYVTSVPNNNDEERPKKKIKTSTTPVSLPYGALILKKKLQNCPNQKVKNKLYGKLVEKIKKAKETSDVPHHLKSHDGYTLYMSGGGFRAFGYLSMATQGSLKNKKMDYPIPIISGYSMTGKELWDLADQYKDEDPELLVQKLKVFRISKRRVRMLPAICFLISAIAEAIHIKRVFFSEGGARQGICYHMLPPSEQSKDPLLEGVRAYAMSVPQAIRQKEYDILYRFLKNAIPSLYMEPEHPLQLCRLIPAALYLANLTTHFPKETRAFAAFNMALAGGSLSDVPGILHSERAVLALILAYRQGGEVPNPIFDAIQELLGAHGVSVCKYVGRLMEVLFLLSPRQPGTALIESSMEFKLEDEEDDTDSSFSSFYRPYKLQIIMPKSCPLLDAPAALSVIESMDKKIQPKKQGQELSEVDPSWIKLFSVSIVSHSV